jgi:hypothetical protein
VRGRAEHVAVFPVLEDARRAAVVEDQELLHLLGDRRHGEAVAGADVADHRVHPLAVVEVAHLLHLLGRAAVLIDVDRLDAHAAEADLVVGRGSLALVESLDHHLRAVDRRHTEAFGGRPGQEAHHAELERLLRRRAGAEQQRNHKDNGSHLANPPL